MATPRNIEIEVNPRVPGKGPSGIARKQNLIPCVTYGPKVENVNLLIKENDAAKYTRREFGNAIITFKSTDSKVNGLKVILKSSTRSPLTHRPTHLDFYAPDMTKTIRVNVELDFYGKPVGASDGGVFSAIRRNVEVECLPTEIPEKISVDISGLGINDSLHVYDLKVPASVKLITSQETPIANVSIIKEEEVVVAAPVEGAVVAGAEGAAAAPGAEGAAAAAPADGKAAAPGKDAKDAKPAGKDKS